MSDENSYWYCQTCDEKLDGEAVTFEELHDPTYGGCGFQVESRSGTPNRPPSCDRLNPELKECPFCGSNNVELRDGYNLDELAQYVRCNSCEADGPWSDDNIGTKWNSIPRRSEVLELLRLVDEVTVFGRALIDTRNFPDAGSFMIKDLDQLKVYADKLRKEVES